MITKMTTVSC